MNRRAVILCAVLWQGGCSALLALGAWARAIDPSSVLICIFALGIGLAFSSPFLGAIVPDLVTKDELASAITLGGVQLNLSGIVGPAVGGLLLPLLGAPFVISINALMFLVVALAVWQWKPSQAQLTGLRENFTESFISSLRYARNSPRMRTILFRDLVFALVISIVPALLPVIALKEMHLSAAQLGVVLSCVGIGSLAGAVFVLPYSRQRTSPNGITSISMAILVAVLFALALMRGLPALMTCATLAGAAWALAGSELWVAGQRVMPGWVRGRMNAFQIMEFIVSTWAEHLRQGLRMTVDEARVFDTVWELHTGDSEPIVRHYLATQKCMHLHGYGFSGRTFTDTSGLSRPKLESSMSSSRA